MSAAELIPALQELGTAEKRFLLRFLKQELVGLPEGTIDEAMVPSHWKIDALAQLEDDWDGMDAPAIAPQTTRKAKNLLEAIYRQVHHRPEVWRGPDVSPTPQGEIYLHWDEPPLEFSVIVALGKATILLIGSGAGRANRLDMGFEEAATAAADLLLKRTPSANVK